MSPEKQSKWEAYKQPVILIACVLVGAVLGIVLGDKAAFLYPIGQIWLNMLFVLLVPLIFFSISSSIAAIGDTRRVFRAGRWCRYGNHADLELRLPECGPADPHHDDPALRPGLHPRQLLR